MPSLKCGLQCNNMDLVGSTYAFIPGLRSLHGLKSQIYTTDTVQAVINLNLYLAVRHSDRQYPDGGNDKMCLLPCQIGEKYSQTIPLVLLVATIQSANTVHSRSKVSTSDYTSVCRSRFIFNWVPYHASYYQTLQLKIKVYFFLDKKLLYFFLYLQ